MDTLEFFNKVLAHQGLVCLLHLDGDRRRQTFYGSHEEAARAARALDQGGGAVYHGCATFQTTESRKQENAAYMRSFWVDADVDPANPEKYPDLKSALIDFARAARELGLPMPLIVKSGNGAHGYWPFTEDVSAGEWHRGASQLKTALHHLGFRQDPTRTADSSSVLRPVGTHWRKAGTRAVEALSPGAPVSFGELVSRLERYAGAHALQPIRHLPFGGSDADDLSAGIEYPPSSADRIIQFCPTLAHVAAERGNVSEPLWRAMLGVVKFTTEGAQRAHEWSAGHPEYDEAATQDKLDRWAAAPTTCAHFRATQGNKCEGCPRNVTSPIQLGYTEQATPPTVAVEQPDMGFHTTPVVEEQIPYWPKNNFRWDGRNICRSVTGAEGQIDWIPFCATKFWIEQRIFNGEEWELQCAYEKRDKKRGSFTVPTSLLGKANELHAALAAQEIVMSGAQGANHVRELMNQMLLELQSAGQSQLTYSTCGWYEGFDAFVIGNQRISEKSESTIMGGRHLQAAGWNRSFGKKGTIENWTKLVNHLYNRPGAEAYQFVLMAAFASPLVQLLGSNNWHGIPIALVGPTGLGKTTVCRFACSIYGEGTFFQMGALKDQATLGALIARIATMKNLPILMDELTKRDPMEVGPLLYALSNGQPKDRLSSDGTLMRNEFRWDLFSFITAQNSIVESLLAMKHGDTVEATQIRIFEIVMSTDVKKIWSDVNLVDLGEHQLQDEYGTVGRVWLPYVISNRQVLKDEMRKLRASMSSTDADQTRERFYRDAVVQVLTATKHARKLGLVDFDVVKLAKWANKQILALRQVRADTKVVPDDRIAHFLGSLNGHTVITQRFQDGRSIAETPLEPVRGVPAARMALQDRRFLVSARALNEWCTENEVAPSWMLEQLRQRCYIIFSEDPTSKPNGSRKERLTRGTTLPSAPEYVFELDYDRVVGKQEGKGDKVAV